MKKGVLITIVILAVLAGLGFAYTQYTYSEGVRAGVLMRFTKKGFLVKTYEGELNLCVFSAQSNTLVNRFWYFTVKDDSVARTLEGLEGKKVQLHYNQIIHHFWWQGETNVFVNKATVIED